MNKSIIAKKSSILLAVSGSGGHIYPAIAIAEALQALVKQTSSISHLNIYFVHSGSVLATKIFHSLNQSAYILPVGKLAQGQSLFCKIKTLIYLPKAFLQAWFLIRKLKVKLVLGTGGSIGLIVMVAALMGRKTSLWEGNAVMGLANKWLQAFVSCVFTVFPKVGSSYQSKHIKCPYPLRSSFFKNNTHIKTVNSSQNPVFKILILGGSQGSSAINQVVSDSLQSDSWRQDLFFYHQTGPACFAKLSKIYASDSKIFAFDFSHNLQKYYQDCDLVFSRAGSGSIWESAFYQKTLVLIPLAHSAGGHQLQNALNLAAQSQVELIQEKDFCVNSFKQMILKLKNDKQKRLNLAKNLHIHKQQNGAQEIAKRLLKYL